MRLMGDGTYRHTFENKEFRTPITREEYEVLRKTLVLVLIGMAS